MSVCLHCGEKNDPGERHCVVCDKEIGTSPLRRIGAEFEASHRAVLPPACVKCGLPADPPPRATTFYWHHPALYFTVLAGVIVYVIVAVVVRKRFELAVPMCEAHFARRRTMRWVAGALFALAVVLPLACLSSKNESIQASGCIGSVLVGLASVIIHLVGERTIRPTLITDEFARFAGADARFLAMLE